MFEEIAKLVLWVEDKRNKTVVILLHPDSGVYFYEERDENQNRFVITSDINKVSGIGIAYFIIASDVEKEVLDQFSDTIEPMMAASKGVIVKLGIDT